MPYLARQLQKLRRHLACLAILFVLFLAAVYLRNLALNTPATPQNLTAIKVVNTTAPGAGEMDKFQANNDIGGKSEMFIQPVEVKCPMFGEFRQLNFLNTSLRHRLCRNIEAYRQHADGYPMCLLQHPIFNKDMLYILRNNSDIVLLLDTQGGNTEIFVYKGFDLISNQIRNYGTWERELANGTLRLALKLPSVTFLDIGSNIGVYSIQAAKLGLPVVSLDANIRNLLRLRLSLDAASLKAELVWNFISTEQSLKYLNFPSTCNVGGATKLPQDLEDTIPVMPLRSGRLRELIKTKAVVMKIDIEGGEADFLRTSGRLFTDFDVAAVQMEWSATWLQKCDASYILGFFDALGYKVWEVPGFRPFEPSETPGRGQEIDIIWVRHDYAYLMQT